MDRIETDRNLSSDLGCRICRENLHLYLEGEAAPLASREIQEHLSRCPDCAAELRVLQEERIAFLEAALSSPPLSPRFSERVIREIRRDEAERHAMRKIATFRRLFVSVGTAAAIVLAGFGIAHVTSGGGSTPTSVKVAVNEGSTAFRSRPRDLERPPAMMLTPGPASPASLPIAAEARSIEELQPAVRMALPDWFVLSEEMFPAERRPCERDLNEDGISDFSDAAHLCMIAVLPFPAELMDNNLQDCDQI
jgi:hypothetical protein